MPAKALFYMKFNIRKKFDGEYLNCFMQQPWFQKTQNSWHTRQLFKFFIHIFLLKFLLNRIWKNGRVCHEFHILAKSQLMLEIVHFLEIFKNFMCVSNLIFWNLRQPYMLLQIHKFLVNIFVAFKWLQKRSSN